jgi:hypothetical protein
MYLNNCMLKWIYSICDDDLYYVLFLALVLITAFDLGLIIGWLMIL